MRCVRKQRRVVYMKRVQKNEQVPPPLPIKEIRNRFALEEFRLGRKIVLFPCAGKWRGLLSTSVENVITQVKAELFLWLMF